MLLGQANTFSRLFSMESIKDRLLFISVKMEMTKKVEESEKYRDRVKKNSIVDGVVFNFLFKYLDYGKKYDAVKAVFPISYIYDDSRMEYLPEPQICVKNNEVLSDYKIYSTDKVPKEYQEFITNYNRVKYSLKQKRSLAKYKTKQKSIKYKKEDLAES